MENERQRDRETDLGRADSSHTIAAESEKPETMHQQKSTSHKKHFKTHITHTKHPYRMRMIM
jgi:hypothetical protein